MVYIFLTVVTGIVIGAIATFVTIRWSIGWYLVAGGFLGSFVFVLLFFVAGVKLTTPYQHHVGYVHWLTIVSFVGAVVCFFVTFGAVVGLIFGSMAKNTGD